MIDSYRAVSFDLGQTLVELAPELLGQKLDTWGFAIDPTLLEPAIAEGWRAYNRAKQSGEVGYSAWRALLLAILQASHLTLRGTAHSLSEAELEGLVTRLWEDQPRSNLWQRPIAGMFTLVQALAERGVAVGVLTNSEGRAKELVNALGLGRWVKTVVDSGVEGIEKPDPRLFAVMAARLGLPPQRIVHVGDSFEADVRGAIGAGMTPVWFGEAPDADAHPQVIRCQNAHELTSLLLSGRHPPAALKAPPSEPGSWG